MRSLTVPILAIGLSANWLHAEPDYAGAMRELAAKSECKPGVVLHVGDSITYANPYGQWARFGKGKTAEDKALLKWMHCGADDATDGWFLARVDRPGGRSDTAASGLRADQLLAGGFRGLPPLKVLMKYRPQMVVLMIGTNDASAKRDVDGYLADVEKAVDTILAAKAIPILSTIPPHPKQGALAKEYNEGLRKLAGEKRIPLIDYEKEILRRQPENWNGTLLGKNDVHPSAGSGDAKPSSEPTEANLSKSGYLLRGWLSVQKIAEVKAAVLD